MSRLSLSGRKCLVTGGTRGIGRAIATEVLALGGEVFVCARSKDDVEATVRDLQQQGKVQGCAADLSDQQQRQQLMQQVSDAFGGELHVLGELSEGSYQAFTYTPLHPSKRPRQARINAMCCAVRLRHKYWHA
eukprot:GHUV01042141.1.p2 GENE.GHUV01042141.1~~GHUV01042141.1.p2  ORF type:complete len:133 (+),score=23.29 GHUV01042141.1:190-588(+)